MGRLADELRAEQDHCAVQEKAKRALTSQLSELEGRLADANEAAAKGGRNAMAKLESRIREMEIELGSVQSKTSDAYKAFQKAERRIKELQFQQDEDKKNQDSMSELAKKLQLSTWLNSERLSKNWKKLRIATKWPSPNLPSVNSKKTMFSKKTET